MWQNKDNFQEKRFHVNMKHLQYFIVSVFIILILRLFFINIIKKSHFYKISEKNRIQIFSEPAPRGVIYDRTGKVLVENKLSFSVLFSPINLTRQVINETIDRLNKILGLKSDYKHSLLGNICLAEDVEAKKIFYLSEQKHNFPGIKIQVRPRRCYLFGSLASHLLGYPGEISKKELKYSNHIGYKQGDIIGKTGIEKDFDQCLRGKDGSEQIEVDVNGRPLRVLSHRLPQLGDNLILTIDKDIQEACESVLQGKKGGICVLNPRNGEVLAMVSKPDFNPNVFIGHTNPRSYRKLFNNPDLPMFNRVIQSQQPPASIFKIVTEIAALEEETVDRNTVYYCHGHFFMGKEHRLFRCWKGTGHGRMDVIDGIAQSCDVFFYHMGFEVGVDNIAKYAFLLGLSEASGFCLSGEKKGLIPTIRWKRENIKECWYPGDTINTSIGQGYVLVTPLQMANLISLVANEGFLYSPFIVRRVVDAENRILKTFEPKLIRKITLKPSTWYILKRGLRRAVLSGTCEAVKFEGLAVAGKTGTAQNPHGEDHAWFVCYAPVKDPQIAMMVYIEHGGNGASVAAPIAREILIKIFDLKEEMEKDFEDED